MSDERLDEILENTRTVKTVVVSESEQRKQEQEKKKEHADKRKEQLKKAQSKFKKVGANIKEADAEKVQAKCDEQGVSVNEYVKRLIDSDMQKEPEEPLPEKPKNGLCRVLSKLFGC